METKKARERLNSKLTENSEEMREMQAIISQLTSSLYSLDGPLRLASTRLAMRAGRHEVELCRDEAHLALVRVGRDIYWVDVLSYYAQEIESIEESRVLIEHKIQDANDALQVKIIFSF